MFVVEGICYFRLSRQKQYSLSWRKRCDFAMVLIRGLWSSWWSKQSQGEITSKQLSLMMLHLDLVGSYSDRARASFRGLTRHRCHDRNNAHACGLTDLAASEGHKSPVYVSRHSATVMSQTTTFASFTVFSVGRSSMQLATARLLLARVSGNLILFRVKNGSRVGVHKQQLSNIPGTTPLNLSN